MTNMQQFALRCYGPRVASLNVRFQNLHMIPSTKPLPYIQKRREKSRQLVPVILQAGFQLWAQTLAVLPASVLLAAESLEALTAGRAAACCSGESHLNCTRLKNHPLVTLFLGKLPNSSRAEILHQSISIVWVSNVFLMAVVFHEDPHKRVFGIYHETLLHENCVKI